MPNHPKIQGAEPTERQVLDAPQPGTGLQPQPGQWNLPGSQADLMMHHPAHHHAQRERRWPSNPKGFTERQSLHRKEAATPLRRRISNIQVSQAKPIEPSLSYPRTNATATVTPYILLYVCRDMAKTTNPKHTPPTRNHPEDKRAPPQYKAEKPDSTAKP
ncbi:hypothetical protein CRENBAI_012830 [Crenichthys baileyi]|uniref:Uncharacterized protein n=1 Tax=Crenichthys baileyi TaxID=28760 RepID=A0AAV9RJX0_9TELE